MKQRTHTKRKWLSTFVCILFVSSIALTSVAPAAAQGNAPVIYVVQPGDTLFSIARRYNLSAPELAQFNGLLNPNMIYIGQEIKIPASSQLAAPAATPEQRTTATFRIHVVQPGENLFRIALKYQVSVGAVATANNLANTTMIFVGQQLSIPVPGEAVSAAAVATSSAPLPDPFLTFEVGPLPASQGGVLVVKVRTREAVTLNGLFVDWNIPFAQEGDIYYGVVGISANPTTGAQPGIYPLSVTAADTQGARVTVNASVQVTAGRYNSEYIDLPPDRQALLDPQLVAAERAKLDAVWTIFNPTRYWSGAFSLPIEKYVKISSPFGTRRAYNGGPFSSYHEGVDFSATGGTPIYAPADGLVVLAEPLTVRGNGILIDHGWGIFSGFYHLSSIDVSVGQSVKAGDFIGRVGNTGLSTGAHLHWDVRIRSLNVDPMQFTRQALP